MAGEKKDKKKKKKGQSRDYGRQGNGRKVREIANDNEEVVERCVFAICIS